MTKKDYELLARVISDTALGILHNEDTPSEKLRGIATLVQNIAKALQKESDTFDIVSFLKACSYSPNDITRMLNKS